MYHLVVRLLEPYTLLLLASFGTALCAWYRQRPRGRWHSISVVLLCLLVVLSTPVVAHLILGTLEWSYPPTTEIPRPDDTIVVLGGGYSLMDDAGTMVRLSNTSMQRCFYAAHLYRQAGRCRVLLVGGRDDEMKLDVSVAEAMRNFMIHLGARPDDLVAEERSLNTYENARNTKAFMDGKSDSRIFLVTNAMHMRRAVRLFLAQGIRVTPAACEHHSLTLDLSPASFIPRASSILAVGNAAHERFGLAWAWISGRL
jgi:uncharacterized SAM-binding protein YcdF (DUF218 family)